MKVLNFLLIAFSFSANAETTIYQNITQINFNGDANISYFIGAAKWGAMSK